jgi:uncharacterized membrane protein YqjE
MHVGRKKPLLAGWRLYVLGTPLVFIFIFVLVALSTRPRHYRSTKLSVLLIEWIVFAALGTLGCVWSMRKGK